MRKTGCWRRGRPSFSGRRCTRRTRNATTLLALIDAANDDDDDDDVFDDVATRFGRFGLGPRGR